MTYRTAKAPARFEQEIKKSRFIGIAIPLSGTEGFEKALSDVRGEFPDATHHCWAYVLGEPGAGRMRADDAGEPSGTAGKPILNVLQRRGVGDVLVVVVRYFGGVKLGAGGLTRAYSSTASSVVDALELVDAAPLLERRLRLRHMDEQVARRLLFRLGIEIVAVSYGDAVLISVRAPEKEMTQLERELSEWTSGRAEMDAPSVGV